MPADGNAALHISSFYASCLEVLDELCSKLCCVFNTIFQTLQPNLQFANISLVLVFAVHVAAL